METIIFRPKLFTARRIAVSALLAFFLFLAFWTMLEGRNSVFTPVLVTWITWIGIFIADLTAARTNSIRIDDQFFHYTAGHMFMKPLHGTIPIADIDRITNALNNSIYSISKGRFFNSLVFYLHDGEKEVVPLFGWDNGTLREVIIYMKGKHPKIKYHTTVYKDSEEKLAGLLDYTEKERNTAREKS